MGPAITLPGSGSTPRKLKAWLLPSPSGQGHRAPYPCNLRTPPKDSAEIQPKVEAKEPCPDLRAAAPSGGHSYRAYAGNPERLEGLTDIERCGLGRTQCLPGRGSRRVKWPRLKPWIGDHVVSEEQDSGSFQQESQLLIRSTGLEDEIFQILPRIQTHLSWILVALAHCPGGHR